MKFWKIQQKGESTTSTGISILFHLKTPTTTMRKKVNLKTPKIGGILPETRKRKRKGSNKTIHMQNNTTTANDGLRTKTSPLKTWSTTEEIPNGSKWSFGKAALLNANPKKFTSGKFCGPTTCLPIKKDTEEENTINPLIIILIEGVKPGGVTPKREIFIEI